MTGQHSLCGRSVQGEEQLAGMCLLVSETSRALEAGCRHHKMLAMITAGGMCAALSIVITAATCNYTS